MINVEEAIKIILEVSPKAKTMTVPLAKANGEFLAQDIKASRDQPPFHRVAMDGIAINSKTSSTKLEIEAVQAAGSPKLSLSSQTNCIEAMTGASLPKNTDCIIPYENIEIDEKFAIIKKKDIKENANIHPMASDYSKDDLLLKIGQLITSPVNAIIASQGNDEVKIFQRPKIAIISTGSELAELNTPVQDHQIYMSNSYAIECELRNFGIESVDRKHIVDDQEKTQIEIKKCLLEYDLIILTGGVSRGKFDFIPQSLENLGVEKLFHKIEQKPGKPMFFGKKNNKLIFGLPGNPVSCLVCLRRYVIPSILKSIGQSSNNNYGTLQNRVDFKKAFTYFVPVKKYHGKDGDIQLTAIKGNGSGDFNSLATSDGFIQLPAGKEVFLPGETYEYFPWS